MQNNIPLFRAYLFVKELNINPYTKPWIASSKVLSGTPSTFLLTANFLLFFSENRLTKKISHQGFRQGAHALHKTFLLNKNTVYIQKIPLIALYCVLYRYHQTGKGDRMILIGIIGVGRWGPNILRNFSAMEDVTVKTVADVNSKRLEEIKKRFPAVVTTTQPDEIVNSSDIDCTVICTPVSTHFELARKALLSGQHVFVEKPLAESSKSCLELIEIAEKKNKTVFVGHTFKYNAGIIAVKNYIDSGDLGQIYLMDATRTNLGPVRYDTNALWDLASHDISIFSYWLGKEPVNVSARGGCYLNNNIEDVVYATFQYPRGIMAHVHASWLNPRKIREITIVGEKKMLVWNDMNLSEPIRIYNQGFDVGEDYQDAFESFRLSIREGEVIIPNIKLNEPLMHECRHFVECILSGTKPLTDGQDGLHVVKALEAATLSIENNSRSVQID